MGAGSDWASARLAARRIRGETAAEAVIDAEIGAAVVEVGALLLAHWPAVLAVAALLERRGTVTGRSVRAAIVCAPKAVSGDLLAK